MWVVAPGHPRHHMTDGRGGGARGLIPGALNADTETMGSALQAHVRGRVEGFDGLRACAAILVVAYHAGSITGASLAGPLAPMVAELKAGVTIFFVISGFLLYLPYARAIRAGGENPDWRRYAVRRAVRIVPAYWVALTVLALCGQVGGVLGPEWWRFFGLVQIYQRHTIHQGLLVAWSLAVEVTFYLALPFFAGGMRRLVSQRTSASAARAQLWILASVATGSWVLRGLLARSLLAPVPDVHLVLTVSLPALADWFVAGMALAVLRAEWEMGSRLGGRIKALARASGRCWLLAALVYAVGVPLQQGEFFLPSYGVASHIAIGLGALLFVLPAVVPGQDRRRGPLTLLCSRQLTWLGVISYGMYLWHQPFRNVIDEWLGAPRGTLAFAGLFVLTLAGAVCLGAASWHLVERPAQRWLRYRSRPARREGSLPAGVG